MKPSILFEHNTQEQLVTLAVDSVHLEGNLTMPASAEGIVLFAHGSGSSRHSPRNRFVAQVLQSAGLATLLFDLLTSDEEVIEQHTRHLRFDINLLATRLMGATDWLTQNPNTKQLKVGYFGASTGAAAALVAAAKHPEGVQAIVSRGGRPDLAGPALCLVQAPTLLIVGGHDLPVIAMNREAITEITAEKQIEIVAGATHLFEEAGALEQVARLACNWFTRYLVSKESCI